MKSFIDQYNWKDINFRSFIIHADLEFLLEKISTCNNNPKKSSTAKTDKHIQLLVIRSLHIVSSM